MEPVDGLLLKVDDLHVEFRTRDGVAKAINGRASPCLNAKPSPFSVNQGRVNR
ncbi:oligopeptide transport ATP-binding protein OppD [Cutibacterium acnes JCM 18918]|nr:oligopeptide transport ATP-binding protein OppD [Cutibacterium acnes JCM 18918]